MKATSMISRCTNKLLQNAAHTQRFWSATLLVAILVAGEIMPSQAQDSWILNGEPSGGLATSGSHFINKSVSGEPGSEPSTNSRSFDTHSFSSPTIPTFHWIYQYLGEMQLRYPQIGFDRSRLPLSVAELDTMLRTLQIMKVARGKALSSGESFWIRRIHSYRQRFGRFHMLQAGVLITEKLGRLGGLPFIAKLSDGSPFSEEEFRSRLAVRSHIGFMPSRDLLFFNTINLDQELGDDPGYVGKRWRGFTGYTEQAYIVWRSGPSAVKLGRDFLVWSHGRDASLLFSDYARPLDQIAFEIAVGRLHFSYIAAKLDEVTLSDSAAAQFGGSSAQRYLSANRVSYWMWRDKLQLGISQAVIYGGPGRSFEWYLNPFIFFHGESMNTRELENTFGSIDLLLRPRPGLEFYGQLLVDDVQIEKTGSGDLEPNEIGYLVGGHVADPFGLNGSTIGAEYTRVANRTYNTPFEFEKFLHRGRPIGHFLGNDFDRWLLFGSSYLGGSVMLNWDVELRRRGEGRIEAPFDQPWWNYDVSEGYREKFPSGTVEEGFLASVEIRWHPRQDFFLSLHLRHSSFDQFQHQTGVKKDITEVYLRGWWEFDKFFSVELGKAEREKG